MIEEHPQRAQVEALYRAALALRANPDPLLAGQYESVIGRLSALLAAMGATVPEDAAAAATAKQPIEPALPSMRLDGMVGIVTGGGGGLGTLGACALAEAGADVVVAARTLTKCEATAEKVRARGRRARAIATDVTDEAQVATMVEATLAQFGRIDILFNNAGITSPKTMLDSSLDEWFHVVDVNVKGTFLCSKAVTPAMKARGFGRIINMGSILSDCGMANRTAYSTSKAGIAHFTQSLAFELGSAGITVNALGPTVIVTDLNRDLIARQPQLYEAVVKRTALGRLGQPPDIAGALVFLASPAAGFITGQTIYVDGGYTAG
jgi:NAD(P)-dependent dehydrogenase (short-subunit alcohol dehydrogenase family)